MFISPAHGATQQLLTWRYRHHTLLEISVSNFNDCFVHVLSASEKKPICRLKGQIKMEENNKTNNRSILQSSSLWIGLVFIGGGAIALLNQMGVLSFEFNWWAFLILIPAIGSFSGAYNRYRATNNLFDMSVMMPAVIGLFMVGLAFNLLIGKGWNFNWSLYWPIILILIGLGMIFGFSRKK